MRAGGAQFLVIGGGALVFREDARPFIAAERVAGGFYLGNKTGDRIGGVFDIEAPEGDWLPTEPVVDLQRLGTKGALAEPAGALNNMSMQPPRRSRRSACISLRRPTKPALSTRV